MRKRYVLSLLACIFAVSVFTAHPSRALDGNMVVSQVQVGSSASASHEFVELYNNSLTDTEITDWCLYYASSTSIQNGSKLACFTAESEYTHLYLPGHSYAFLASNQLGLSAPELGSDLVFAAGMAATAGHVRLLDGTGAEVDKVGWGTAAVSAEGSSPAPTPATGKVLQRKSSGPGTLQDTNINSDDFELAVPRASYEFGVISEVIDLCYNVDGVQATVPADHTVDSVGICLPPPVDVCDTIAGLQVSLPVGYELDEAGQCQPDTCLNLTGLQLVVPEGYVEGSDGMCLLNLLPIKITELLANPAGSDTDNEYIELYNPNNTRVDLGLYRIRIGTDTAKVYEFPMGSSIAPSSYKTFSNSDIPYTLVNSSQVVAVTSLDNVVIDQAVLYQDPKDDMAWALIDGTWRYTNQPTPGSPNIASFIETEDKVIHTSEIVPCSANQYRSPETGRCRLLTAANSSVLVPCKEGQYRSEETNRCRNTVSNTSSLVACNDNQERNPETGRCRLIASVLGTSLVACKEGQERNPATNRCRNSTSAMSVATYPVEATVANAGGYWGWLALGGVGVLAIGYGIWEWRGEVFQASRKIATFFHFKK